MRELWRRRDARLYLLGQLLSVFGDSTLWLGAAIWTKKLTGSSSRAGLVFFAFAAGTLLSPLAGWVVDRVRRRRLLIVTNAASGVLVLLLLFVGKSSIWLIYLVMAGYGVSGAIVVSAQTAFLPYLVPEELFAAANGVLTTGREAVRVVTPLLAAGVVAWTGTAKPVAVVDAASFAIVVVTLLAMHVEDPRAAPPTERLRVELLGGVRHMLATRVFRQVVAAAMLALFVLGFSETLVFAVNEHGLHRSPAFVGVIDVFQGVGSIAAGLAAAAMIRRWNEGRVIACAFAVMGVGHGLWALPSPIAVLAGAAVAGAAFTPAVTAYLTLLQRLTPDRLRGRVLSAADTAMAVPQTVSIALGAVLILSIDYRLLVAVEAVIEVAAGIWLLSRREQRELPSPARAEEVATPVNRVHARPHHGRLPGRNGRRVPRGGR